MTDLFFGPLVMQAYKGEKLHFIPILRIINSQSLEDTQVGYISEKYTLDKNTSEKCTLKNTLLVKRKERQWGTCGADWASCCNVVTRPSLLLQQLSPPNISRDCSNCHWGDHSLAEFIYSWFALKCNTHNENFPFQANFSPLQRLFSSF